MWVYFVLFIVIAISAFMVDNYRPIVTFIYFGLFAFLFIFQSGVGTDYQGYKLYYGLIEGIQDISVGGFEPGYNLLALLFRKLDFSYEVFRFFLNFVLLLFFYKATVVFDLNIGLTTLLALFYFFYPSIESIRQSVALVLFYYSLAFLIEDNTKKLNKDISLKYIVINCIGFLFHRTALFAFVFLLFIKSKFFKLLFSLFVFCFHFFQMSLVGLIESYLPVIYSRYHIYFYKELFVKTDSVLSIKLIEYFVISILLFVLLFLNRSDSSDNRKRLYNNSRLPIIRFSQKLVVVDEKLVDNVSSIILLSFNLVVIGLLIQLFVSPVVDASYRLIYYCDFGIMLFYSTLYNRQSEVSCNNSALGKVLYTLFLILYVGIRLLRVFPFDNSLFSYHIFSC